MKSTYFTIRLGKNLPPPQNGCRLKSVLFYFILFSLFVCLFVESTGFTSSTFPIQPDFSQNQLAAITLNTGSPWTLVGSPHSSSHTFRAGEVPLNSQSILYHCSSPGWGARSQYIKSHVPGNNGPWALLESKSDTFHHHYLTYLY
jgi:hypothetical protein